MLLLNNYQNDLQKSRTTPLLIELSKKDLDAMCQGKVCGVTISIALAQVIYDNELKDKTKTNLIYIDANKYDSKDIYLFSELLESLDERLKNEFKNDMLKTAAGELLSFFTSGAIKDLVSYGLQEIGSDAVKDVIEYFAEVAIEQTPDKIIDTGTSYVETHLSDVVIKNTIKLVKNLQSTPLYLSEDSVEEIKKLHLEFSEKQSPANYFRIIIKLMLAMSIETKKDKEKPLLQMPKIIFIKNPHKLDKNSLAILSMLYSISKDMQNTHTGISIIYAYDDEDFQPYNVKNGMYKESKLLLDDQRRFTQRYAMLERPSSDIPKIAVKSHIFVGRESELKVLQESYDNSKNNPDKVSFEVISGDAGIGKTKLVKKHLEEIKNQDVSGGKQIHLTLLNQVGHSSSNTGIASLSDSIRKELDRLIALKILTTVGVEKTFMDTINIIKNSCEEKLGIRFIKSVSEVMGNSGFKEGRDESALIHSSEREIDQSKEQREEQFYNLTEAIRELKYLSDSITHSKEANVLSADEIPIVLFIDDLQWIDEDSSEYILKYFIEQKHFNIHIVATTRPADSSGSLKKAYENRENNLYTVALLKKAGIKIYETEVISELNTDKLVFKQRDELKGLNFTTLTSLISQVIKPIKEDNTKQTILAKTIIKELNNDKSKDEVHTLFAVETLNMLCDEKLYTTQKKDEQIEKLIVQEGTTLVFNPNITNFQESLSSAFAILHDKYKKAFEHINAEQKEIEFKQKFNLMAYAVLEERLNILKIYFADHGNAAVNTLLFSSWLGTTFHTTVVKDILESLSKTEDKLLQPLKKYIKQSKNNVSINFFHYEIIEEVYEILNRYVNLNNSYRHSHSLLSIFLDSELTYLIGSIFENNTPSINRTYSYVADKIISFDTQVLPLRHAIMYLHNIMFKALINQRKFDNFIVIYDWYMNKFSKLYDDKKFKLIDYSLSTMIQHTENQYNIERTDEWSEKYFNILWKGVSLNDRLFNPKAIEYIKKIHQVIQFISSTDEGNKLKGELFYKTGGYKYLHVSYKEGLKELLLSVKYLKYVKRSSVKESIYIDAQATLSYTYGRIGELLQRSTLKLKSSKKAKRLLKALNYHQKSLLIIENLQTNTPNNLIFLTKVGVVYERIGQVHRLLSDNKNALHNFEKALKIKEKHFKHNGESFGYRKILIVLSDFYRENSMQKEANILIIKAKELTNTKDMNKYIDNKDQYQLESYFKIFKQYCIVYPNREDQEKIQKIEEVLINRALTMEY